MQEKGFLFAPPTMPEQAEMFSDSVREYIRFPRPADVNDDLKTAEFLVEEAHTEATGLLVLSMYLARETASLLAHLNSLKY